MTQKNRQNNNDTKDGTVGFDPKLGGHAKAGKSHTSGFGPEKPPASKSGAGLPGGQEEGARHKHPNTSAVVRILPHQKKENNHDS